MHEIACRQLGPTGLMMCWMELQMRACREQNREVIFELLAQEIS